MKRLIIVIVLFTITLLASLVFYLGLQRNRAETTVRPTTLKPTAQIMPAIEKLETKTGLPATTEEIKKYQAALPDSQLSPDKTQRAVWEKTLAGNFLKIVDRAGETKLRFGLNLEDVDLVWFKKGELALIEKPTALIPGSAWVLNLKEETLKPLAVNEPGLMLRWSPTADYRLQSSGKNLVLINTRSQETLRLPQTSLPSKCVFGQEKLYCALPEQIPDNIVWPDDYLKRKFYSRDEMAVFDFSGGAEQLLNVTDIDAVDLLPLDNWLYFTNRRDNKVYKIKL